MVFEMFWALLPAHWQSSLSGICVLVLPLYLLSFLGLWSWICKKCFLYFLVRSSEMYNKHIASKKHKLFSNLRDFAGPSGKLSLLELDCGTGANFKFYPPGCMVTCVYPNPNFEKFLIKSIAENRHLQFKRFVVAAGENMHQVTNSSMDTVVCTLVPCSVESQEQILQEGCRVRRGQEDPGHSSALVASNLGSNFLKMGTVRPP
ncbi:methyltransferase-like protein 7A [Phyllostomus discolor]|uniref:Methyltransferase-like protein 7A n=1 Tax=Phyllostomus discolor TaxID=89673 RepID=A0A6J2NCK4_9CHIR|nr:methyltransferase-like protein 7A [Phyllostomus discolor]